MRKVHDYQRLNSRLILYYKTGKGTPAAINTSRAKFMAWLEVAGKFHTVLSSDGEDTEVPMTENEYWQCLPKATHLEDLSDFLNHLMTAK